MLLYHATNSLFTKFSTEFAGLSGEWSTNGALGIWFFTDKQWPFNLKKKYVIEARVLIQKSYDMPVSRLSSLSRSYDAYGQTAAVELWKGFNKELIEDGYDSVRIIEKDTSCSIMVVLDAKSIKGFKLIS